MEKKFKNGMFFDKHGNILTPNPDDPLWNENLKNLAQTSMVIYKLFGKPDFESHKDYMGIVSIAINTFMLDSPEEKSEYANELIQAFQQQAQSNKG